MASRKLIFTIFFSGLLFQAFSQKLHPAVSEANLKKHVYTLASDKMKGRGIGMREELDAANDIDYHFKKMKLEPKGNLSSYLYSFKTRKRAHAHDTIGTGDNISGLNVVAYLDNKAEFTIVIGAHFDHLGLGHDHNSRDTEPEGKIHNGADDNASGVAGVLELARYFKYNNIREKYNFLFICFSGAELGLLGSKKYCENPTIDLSRVNYMINLDMIGRLNDTTKRLLVYGVGTGPDFVPWFDKNPGGFSLKLDSSGIGPSDQTSFYLKGIPVLHFFTGQHEDYHKPGDDPEKVNYRGQKDVVEYVIRFVMSFDEKPRQKFQTTRNTMGGRTGFKVTLGIMPDYTFEGTGLRLDGVSAGKPADLAGLKKGDVIIRMGDLPIQSVKDYMECLGKYNKGDSTTLEIIRENKNMVVPVTF